MVTLDDFYGSRQFHVTSDLELQTDGRWKVVVEVVHKRRKKLEDAWEVKDMHCTVFNDDVDRAIAEASITVSTYLDSIGGDLFNEEEPQKDTPVQ